MAIDILQIKPHEISRNLKGYTIVFYGQPKTGVANSCFACM